MSKRSPGVDAPWTRGAALSLSLSLACGSASLDAPLPSHDTGSDGGTSSGTSSALDTGPASSSGAPQDDTGDDTPAFCAPGCRIVLPSRWSYEGIVDPLPIEPGMHWIPSMLREPDGGIIVAEQRRGGATLHRLDAAGILRWHRPLPLPCERCELGEVTHHPSGDLLLGAVGHALDGEYGVLAGRYDPGADALSWSNFQPQVFNEEVPSRSGSIVPVSDSVAVQLFVLGTFDFAPQHTVGILVYSVDGELFEREWLSPQSAQARRWSVMARRSPSDVLVAALPSGTSNSPYALLTRMQAPFWGLSMPLSLPQPLDDLEVDERDHVQTLAHTFDGERIHLLLDDRNELEPQARWVATLAVPSTTESRAELARGPDGDLYTAVRITQRIELPGSEDEDGSEGEGEPPVDPLVGLSLARWSSDGELRWSTMVLMDVTEGPRPVALDVDHDESLLVATVGGDRLRVERWDQRCHCE